jgi:hypothetical protein
VIFPANESSRILPPVYTEYSDREGDFVVTIPPGATVRIIPAVSTIFGRHITVAASAIGAIASTLIVRKYFMAGSKSVDETFAMPIATAGVFVSSSPLESVEVLVTNNNLAAIDAFATLIVRS